MQSDKDSNRNTNFVYGNVPINNNLQMVQNASIPFAVHYNTFNNSPIERFDGNAKNLFLCKSCGSFFNSYCEMINEKIWICNICYEENENNSKFVLPKFPYTSSEHTYEISIGQPKQQFQRSLIFLVDLCIGEKQMKSVKQTLINFVQKTDQNTRIGLITYSQHVYVYNLKDKINTVVCIASHIPYSTLEVSELLRIGISQNQIFTQAAFQKYIVKISQCKQRLIKKINAIKAQQNFSLQSGKRQRSKRAIGQALNISIILSQISPQPSRIVTLIGGPCTHGVGKVIGTNYKEQIRSMEELQKGQSLGYFESSKKFYNSLVQKILSRGTVVDAFIFCVQETGLAEMYELIRISGGSIVLHEEFSGTNQVFPKSFEKIYINESEESHYIGSAAVLTVFCSPYILLNGALGQCYPLKKISTSQYFSQKTIGYGETNCWYLGSIDNSKTLTIVYQIDKTVPLDQEGYVMQFRLSYIDKLGNKVLKVTTVQLDQADNINQISSAFNQQAALLTLCRLYIHKSLYEQKRNYRLWLDKILLQWASTFASYIKADERSFSLPKEMKYLPQSIYYFRRTPLFRKSGISVDEFYYHSHILNRDSIENCLLMIQPALLSYSLESIEPKAVNLDHKQMKESSILLLDTYFNIVLWYGQNIHAWEQEGYHEKQDYGHVKQLLEAPNADIQYLLNSRFPYPAFYKTHPNHSKERFLKSKVSPTKAIEENENMISDESDLVTFTRYLIHVVVNQKLA